MSSLIRVEAQVIVESINIHSYKGISTATAQVHAAISTYIPSVNSAFIEGGEAPGLALIEPS
jgi:hypothetical protein